MIAAIMIVVGGGQDAPGPTWSADIRPIIAARCQECHTPSGIGPFSLVGYDDVTSRATFLVEVIEAGLMPPWLPDETDVPLRHKREVTAEEVAVIKAWIAAGKPRGSDTVGPPLLPTPTPSPVTASRSITMTEPWLAPAEGWDAWHSGTRDVWSFVTAVGNTEELFVRGVSYQASSPQVVDSVAFVADDTGRLRTIDRRDDVVGHQQVGDNGWEPAGALGVAGAGGDSFVLPKGFSFRLPPRCDLGTQLHFRPSGREQRVQDTAVLELGESTDREVVTLLSMIREVRMSAGEIVMAHDGMIVPVACEIVAVTPRGGPWCAAMSLVVDNEDGTRRVLSISEFDSHYRQTYVLQSPLAVSEGDVIHGGWAFDNTAANPRNLHSPPIDLQFGRRTGVGAFILHVAAVDPAQTQLLRDENVKMIKQRQRSTNR